MAQQYTNLKMHIASRNTAVPSVKITSSVLENHCDNGAGNGRYTRMIPF